MRKVRSANCPSCGGIVEFRVSTSLVTICPYCQCVVARGDKAIEDHGKVADLVLTNSPLQLGVTGRHNKHRFELIGRVQYKHPAGGVWNEWYLAFADGKWGWLAEAQGKFYLTYEKKLKKGSQIPEFSTLEPGKRVQLGPEELFTVTEIGVAQTGSAEGEIPWMFEPQTAHRFADLHGGQNNGRQTFATFDYNNENPRLFLGTEVEIADLELSDINWLGRLVAAAAGVDPEAKVQALTLNCPHCSGPLQLHAPDQSERVGCPHCGALLDCRDGKLEYLHTLSGEKTKPYIPLGTTGLFREKKYTVIGFMVRCIVYDRKLYPWHEYLLQGEEGFRWLVCSNLHWSFVEPVSPHEVEERFKGVSYQKKNYRLYEKSIAFVRYVVGEFYWKVEVGEEVEVKDYIAPPHILSFEQSGTEEHKELNVSLGTYVPVEDIEQAFGVEKLRRPIGVGMIQPKPVFTDVYRLWGWFLLALTLLFALMSGVLSKPVDAGFFMVVLVLISIMPVATMLYCYNFEVTRWKDSDHSPYS